jgi:serine/threonine-protein kinase
LETRGREIPVQTGVAFNPTTTFANFGFSRDGTLIYRNDAGSGSAVLSTVQWLDRDGSRKALIAMPGVYNFPRLSPDGVKLAVVTSAEGTQRLSIYVPGRGSPTPLTFDGGQIQGVVWTPDGHSLVFNMANLGISSVRTDGAGKPTRLLNARTALTEPSSFSPNGEYLAYMDTGSLQDIFTVRVTENGGQLQAGNPEPFLETQFWEDQPRFSRDGHWIAYRTDETGRMEVNVRAFPRPSSGEGAKIPISTEGGARPVWSRKANELYYQSGDQIMHVSFRDDADNFIAEPPGVWAELGGATFWDMGPDERAVITAPVKTSGSQQAPETDHHIVFLQNFFDELRRRVPASAK